MTEQSPRPGDVAQTLDELTAFDAMRAFLEAYWERGERTSDDIAVLLGNLNRNVWANGNPSDPAQWADWKAAVAKVMRLNRNGHKHPVKTWGG